jgi:RimJ/RimL family protein N-acetyltransferase
MRPQGFPLDPPDPIGGRAYDRAVTGMRLEPLAERHLPGFAAILADDDVLRFTRVPVPVPPGFEHTWLQAYEQGRGDGTREAFAIVEGEAFLGLALAPRIDRETRTAELGYVVSPTARGRGVATEALRLLTDWSFSALGALRLELLINVENEASKRVAERCGYQREGVLRSLHVKQGLRGDTEIWSRLPTDP